MSRAKPRILLVDDDPDILDSLGTLLRIQMPASEISVCSDATAALQKLKEAPCDLIITDYMMPGMDGLALLAELRHRAIDVPKIMITAFPDADIARQAVEVGGASMVITKPFDLDQFVKIVQSMAKGQ